MDHSLQSFLIGLTFALPVIAFWLWMFQDMAKNDRIPSHEKDTWTLMFIFLSLLAAGMYYANIYRFRRH